MVKSPICKFLLASSQPVQAHYNQRSPRSIHESHVLQLWLNVRAPSATKQSSLPSRMHPTKQSPLPSRMHLNLACCPTQMYFRYSFTPVSWILPSEYTKFMRDYYQEREKDESCLFIAKPADLSRGRFVPD